MDGKPILFRPVLLLVRPLKADMPREPIDPALDWPYCTAAKLLSSPAMTNSDGSAWDQLQWRKCLEIFGNNDEPLLAKGPGGETDGVW